MEDINYADGAGHPAEVDQERLADKLLGSFQHIIHRARREAGELALEESDVEAVRCEEACDAGADATQERPRRSDAGAATRSPEHLPGSRVDVLDTKDAYPGWERDLRSEHSVILNPKTDKKNSPSSARSATNICPTGPISKITVRAASTLDSWRRPRC